MDEDVRAEGERIAALLDEVRGMAGPSTWPRVQELVQRLVSLYGAALERVLQLVAGDGPLDPDLAARLAADERVSSVLLVHGLHPVPTAERVARAVDALGERLGGDLEAIELVAVAQSVARVRVRAGADRRCGFSAAALSRAVEQAILEAAPELARVEVEGLAPPPPQERLVTLGGRAGAGVAR